MRPQSLLPRSGTCGGVYNLGLKDFRNMNRRTFLQGTGLTLLLPLLPRPLLANKSFRRRRPSDTDWPSPTLWKMLRNEVDGNLIPIEFPIEVCLQNTDSAACKKLQEDLNNPYYFGDQPSLTQTLGGVDAWFTKPREIFRLPCEAILNGLQHSGLSPFQVRDVKARKSSAIPITLAV
jgi:hypothetical protein